MMRKGWWLIVAATAAGAAWALDPPRPAPTTQPAAATAGEQSTPPAEAPAEQEPATPAVEETSVPPPAPEAPRTGPTPQRFDPTEEVRADFPVSFPSDI
jgi:hypothetical protein